MLKDSHNVTTVRASPPSHTGPSPSHYRFESYVTIQYIYICICICVCNCICICICICNRICICILSTLAYWSHSTPLSLLVVCNFQYCLQRLLMLKSCTIHTSVTIAVRVIAVQSIFAKHWRDTAQFFTM